MKSPGFFSKQSDFSTSRPLATLVPECYEPGESAMEFNRGDFILVKGNSLVYRLIKFGQKMRIFGEDRKYVDWAHAALIVDRDGTLIEAKGTGVKKSSLDDYAGQPYQIFRIQASDEDRDQEVEFARWALDKHTKYGKLTIASIALSLLTGRKLTFFIDGQFVCSGLVASALERAGSIFNRNAANIMPADLAKYFDPAQRPYLEVSRTSSPVALLPRCHPEALEKTVRAS
ncbi:MAG TPA: hypothetical protein VJT72_18760 [Pseudonocardiaceae bacterium]|nr:hypothetical protein [Pseudonocardiaceae bacterium]